MRGGTRKAEKPKGQKKWRSVPRGTKVPKFTVQWSNSVSGTQRGVNTHTRGGVQNLVTQKLFFFLLRPR